MRVDKWLWAVRLYRTRSLASAACRAGSVTVGGQVVKPSREVKVDDFIVARNGEVNRTVKVLGLLERRVGAEAAKQFALDLTPASEYEKPRELQLQPLFLRPKGAGRPTKKERRAFGKLADNY
jgi:ribosome-associated heat shock protein Hsp15